MEKHKFTVNFLFLFVTNSFNASMPSKRQYEEKHLVAI